MHGTVVQQLFVLQYDLHQKPSFNPASLCSLSLASSVQSILILNTRAVVFLISFHSDLLSKGYHTSISFHSMKQVIRLCQIEANE